MASDLRLYDVYVTSLKSVSARQVVAGITTFYPVKASKRDRVSFCEVNGARNISEAFQSDHITESILTHAGPSILERV